MKSSLLPEPLNFLEYNSLEEQEKFAYDYFISNIKADTIREKYENINIELDNSLEYLDGKEKSFRHLCGFGKDSYDIDPCLNSEVEILCKTSCKDSSIPNSQRNLCLYRARTLAWFNYVLKSANNEDEHIKIWEIKEERKLKIRFTHETADYLIVINKFYDSRTQKIRLKLITAYPLFLKGDRKKADREYNKYKK